jgi:glutathione synthase/RimK-type ligase-like ATP-grasp enzyme
VNTLRGGRGPRIGLASCAEFPKGLGGEAELPDLLAARGADPAWAVWDDPQVDWEQFDLVVVRCTWDYPDHLGAFRAWVQSTAMSAVLVNQPRIIYENLHKGYLADLGGDAVPTIVVPAGMTVDLDALGWPSAVVKPAVGLGGNGAVRHATQADLDALTLVPQGGVDVVVQPYLDSVERDGEMSIVCFDGEPSHAVWKKPAVGEFRIHEHRGGTAERVPLHPDHAEIARRMLAQLPMQPAIARVDLLQSGDRALVCELELVEPYLWLELAPEAAARLADSLVARARAARLQPL